MAEVPPGDRQTRTQGDQGGEKVRKVRNAFSLGRFEPAEDAASLAKSPTAHVRGDQRRLKSGDDETQRRLARTSGAPVLLAALQVPWVINFVHSNVVGLPLRAPTPAGAPDPRQVLAFARLGEPTEPRLRSREGEVPGPRLGNGREEGIQTTRQ